jgi:hypothetical protein
VKRPVSLGSSALGRRASRIRNLKSGNCRNSLTPSRIRREVSAARLEKQWNELLLHATIVKDPEKILWLTAELDRCNRRAEAAGRRIGKSIGV